MVVSTLFPSEDDFARIVPARPNWSSPVRESYEFKTDIITSWDKKEQRRAVRYNPRKAVEFNADVWGRDKFALDYFLAAWLPHKAILPDFLNHVETTVQMEPEGQTVGVVSDEVDWAYPGRLVVIAFPAGMETRTILSSSEGSFSFSDFSYTPIPAGARIYPAHVGRIEADQKLARATSNHGSLRIRFNVEPGSFLLSVPQGQEFAGYREAFNKKPNWRGGIGIDHMWERQTVDYGFGQVAHFTPQKFPGRVTKFDFVGRSKAETKFALDFFLRHRGRAQEFVIPTWDSDIPYLYIAAGSSAIVLDGVTFGGIYANSTVFRRIVLRMADGRLFHRGVDFVEALPDTNSSVVWTTEPLPTETLSPATMHGVSWGLVSRFASDRFEIDWLTDSVSQFAMSFQSLENFDL